MANITELARSTIVGLSPEEAANIIALLAGQLAGAAVAGSMGGACPQISYLDEQQHERRMVFGVIEGVDKS